MDETAIYELVYGLLILCLFLSISWSFYFGLQERPEMSMYIDQRATASRKTPSQPDVKTTPSYQEDTKSQELRHRKSKDANLTSEDVTGDKEGRAKLNGEKSTVDAILTSGNVKDDMREGIAEANTEKATDGEKIHSSNLINSESQTHKSQTKGDIGVESISKDENVQKSSKEDNIDGNLNVQDAVNVEPDTAKCGNDNESADKGVDDSNKNLDSVKDNKYTEAHKSQTEDDIDVESISKDGNVQKSSKEDKSDSNSNVQDDVNVEPDTAKCGNDNKNADKGVDDSKRKLDSVEDAKFDKNIEDPNSEENIRRYIKEVTDDLKIAVKFEEGGIPLLSAEEARRIVSQDKAVCLTKDFQ